MHEWSFNKAGGGKWEQRADLRRTERDVGEETKCSSKTRCVEEVIWRESWREM